MDEMRILYVGNFKPSHSTENHLAATLELLGHHVLRFQEDDESPDNLMAAIKASFPDLFMFTRTWGETVTHEHLAELKWRGIPSVSYHLDLYVGLKRDGGIDSDPFWRTDFVFTPDGDPDSAAFFKQKGINHIYQRPGVFAPECYIAQVPISRDVIFVGSYSYHPEWPYRQRLIDWLRENYGPRFELWGNHPDRAKRGHALNELYASSKIVVGDSLCLGFDHQEYWSDRVFETTGRGGFIIHPYIKGLDDCFVDGKEIVFYRYGDFIKLKDHIDYYLAHDEEREAIRLAGHKHTKSEHTYTNRLTRMLEIIKTRWPNS